MSNTSIISEQSLIHYLTDKVECEVNRMTLTIGEETVWYLVNLLNHFAQSNNFFIQELKHKTIPTLAFLYKDATETQSESDRNKLLRKLGDSSLFMGAWFSEMYNRKGIRTDYFIGMGNAAYDYLAGNDFHQPQTFAELAKNLPQLMHISAKVLAKEGESSTDEIVELHKQWVETKDPLIEKQLKRMGVVLIDTSTKN